MSSAEKLFPFHERPLEYQCSKLALAHYSGVCAVEGRDYVILHKPGYALPIYKNELVETASDLLSSYVTNVQDVAHVSDK